MNYFHRDLHFRSASGEPRTGVMDCLVPLFFLSSSLHWSLRVGARERRIQGKELCDLVLLWRSNCSSWQASNTGLTCVVLQRPLWDPLHHTSSSQGWWALSLPSVMVTISSCPRLQLYTHILFQPHCHAVLLGRVLSRWFNLDIHRVQSAHRFPDRQPSVTQSTDEWGSSSPGLCLQTSVKDESISPWLLQNSSAHIHSLPANSSCPSKIAVQ